MAQYDGNVRLCTFFLLVSVVLVALSGYDEYTDKEN